MSSTVSASLKRDLIMKYALKEMRTQLVALGVFSIAFNSIPLEGTDKMKVPYYPLATAASKDFNQNNGYEFGDNYQTQTREVTVNKRKYQPLSFTSQDLARQPHLDAKEIGKQIGRKLAEDVYADILSAVNAANFGAAVFTGAAALFDFATVNGTVGTACDAAKWRNADRSIVVDPAYYRNVVTDLGDASAYLSDDPVKRGVLEGVAGFDMHNINSIPANDENLVGFAALPSAMIIGFSPITPAKPEKVDYKTLSDPSGLTIECREWYDEDADMLKSVIECNYGYAVGEAAALKRIVSA